MAPPGADPRLAQTFLYLESITGAALQPNAGAKFYHLGDDLFPDLLADLETAQHFIFLEYFIVDHGVFWDSIVEVLRRKAAAGVDVRVLYDDLGSISTYTAKDAWQLHQYGIRCVAFNPLLFVRGTLNCRDPFSYEQPGISLAEYGLEDDIIGFLQIPALDLELPVLLGANEENLKLGAAHLTQTSYPIGGENTNCVLAAHRGYYKAPMLREVERLQIGDTVYLQNFRETLTYTVSELRIIDPSDVNALLIQPGRDLLTLVTCHPLGSNRQRYVVYCERAA